MKLLKVALLSSVLVSAPVMAKQTNTTTLSETFDTLGKTLSGIKPPHPVHPTHPTHPIHPVHPVHPIHPVHPVPTPPVKPVPPTPTNSGASTATSSTKAATNAAPGTANIATAASDAAWAFLPPWIFGGIGCSFAVITAESWAKQRALTEQEGDEAISGCFIPLVGPYLIDGMWARHPEWKEQEKLYRRPDYPADEMSDPDLMQ